MTSGSHNPSRFGSTEWAILLTLLALSVLAGLWSVAGLAATWFAALLFPPALGLPAFIPPLRFTPLGETTTTVWAIDLAGAVVMLLAALLWLLVVARKRPQPSLGRAFGRGLWVTVVAVVLGNMVRGAGQSFIIQADFVTYAGQLLVNILVSALTAFALGLVVGLIALIVRGVTRKRD